MDVPLSKLSGAHIISLMLAMMTLRQLMRTGIIMFLARTIVAVWWRRKSLLFHLVWLLSVISVTLCLMTLTAAAGAVMVCKPKEQF